MRERVDLPRWELAGPVLLEHCYQTAVGIAEKRNSPRHKDEIEYFFGKDVLDRITPRGVT